MMVVAMAVIVVMIMVVMVVMVMVVIVMMIVRLTLFPGSPGHPQGDCYDQYPGDQLEPGFGRVCIPSLTKP